MGSQRTSFGKLQRDRDKKAKAAAKRERRLDRRGDAEESGVVVDTSGDGELSPAQLLHLIEQVHRQYESKEIDQEEFEEKKADLLARLPID